MLRKIQGEPLKPDHVFRYVRLPFSWPLSQAEFLTLAPGRLSHIPSCCESILRLTIESVQRNQVYLSGLGHRGLLEWWQDPWSFFQLSNWDHLLLRCVGNAGICRQPAWGIPPVEKVLRLRVPQANASHTLREPHWIFSNISPKTIFCLPYLIMLSTYFSDITVGLSPTTFL